MGLFNKKKKIRVPELIESPFGVLHWDDGRWCSSEHGIADIDIFFDDVNMTEAEFELIKKSISRLLIQEVESCISKLKKKVPQCRGFSLTFVNVYSMTSDINLELEFTSEDWPSGGWYYKYDINCEYISDDFVD